MRYVKATNTGKGFITHADKALLSFSGKPNDMWEIEGTTIAEDAWIARVSGVEKTQQEADDEIFAVTKYIYTSREFLTEVLTGAEVQFLLNNYGSSTPIRNFVNHILDYGVNVSHQRFIDFINAVRDAGYLDQTRVDEITAGRTA